MKAEIKAPFSGFVYLEHQIAGIEWMIQRESEGAKFCRGGILGDDMGLGKTWQTIGLLINSPVPLTLIVAPPVLIGQWSAALEKSNLSVSVLKGGKLNGKVGASVMLCSYGGVKNEMLCGLRFDRIILDEGQYIRNGPQTSRFKCLDKLISERRWILSGTPVQNKISDFKNLALWLRCDSLKKNAFVELAAAIILRRSITLLADKMPAAPTHIAHRLDFRCDVEENKFKVLIGAVDAGIVKNVNQMWILEMYLRVQQFISHPQIYREAVHAADWENGATKFAKFKEIIADTSEPTLVFCQFRKEMEILGAAATALGYHVGFVRGGMSELARATDIEASRSTGVPTILFCQITAGNCGLNLQHLTRVIFYTQHWNPSVIDQAMARSYRFGQTKAVTIHHLIISSEEMLNIDRLMLEKHREKRGVAISLMPSLNFAYHPEI